LFSFLSWSIPVSSTNLTLALRIQADLKRAYTEVNQLTTGIRGISGAAQQAAGSTHQMNAAMSAASANAARATGNLGKIRAGYESISRQLERNEHTVKRLSAAWISFRAISTSLSGLQRAADAWTNLENRLKLVTNSQEELTRATADVFRIAQETAQPLESTATVYQRFAQNADRLGLSMEAVSSITSTVAKAIAISGGSAESANAALVQFGQALASGMLRGEEFNSVSEQAPALLMAIANGLETDIGQLRKMAAEGELTADKIVTALQRAKSGVDEQFGTRTQTIAQGMTQVGSAFQKLVGEISKSGGFGAAAADTLAAFAKGMEGLAGNAEILAAGALAAVSAALARLGVASTRAAISLALATAEKHRAAQAALVEAKAEMAAAQASLAHERAAVGLGTSLVGLAAAETRAAAAAAGLAAASARAATLARVGSSLLGVFGGPAGLAATVAITAGSFYLFRDRAEAVRQTLSDLSADLEEAKKKFAELSTASQQATLAGTEAELSDLRNTYLKEAREIARLAKDELRAVFSTVGPETKAALTEVMNAVRAVNKGEVADWDAVAEAIAGAADMSDDLRQKLLILVGNAQKTQMRGRELAAALTEIKDAAANAISGVQGLNAALSKTATAAAVKEIEKLRAKMADLRDPSAAGRFDRNILPTLGNADKQAINDYRQAFIEFDALEKAARKTGSGGAKRDRVQEANLSKQAELTRQLAEAEQRLAKAHAGVFESQTKARDATELWLQTDKEALRLSEKERAARLAQADAVDVATRAFDGLAAAKKRADEIQTRSMGVDIERLRLSGNETEADKQELEQRFREYAEMLQTELNQGNFSVQAKIDALIEVKNLSQAQLELDRVIKQLDQINTAASQRQSMISANRETGIWTEVEAQDALIASNKKQAEMLRSLLPDLERMAQLPGKMGEQARAAIAEMNAQVVLLENTASTLEATLKDGISSGLTSAIKGLADGTMTLRDAVHELSSTIFETLLDMYVKNFVGGLMKPDGLLGGLFKTAVNAGAGAASGEAAGTVASGVAESAGATALSTAATALSASGGMLDAAATTLTTAGSASLTGAANMLGSAAGGPLMSAAAALTTAATALSGAATALATASAGSGTANAIGAGASVMTAADGGAVPGFSPHDRADNILSWLTAGEFVARRKVMRQPGALSFMRDFNQVGMDALRVWAARLSGFADGGPVRGHFPAPPTGMSPAMRLAANFRPQTPVVNTGPTSLDNRIALNLIDDPDRIAQALRSSAGEKAFTVLLSRDPQKFRQLLGV
jgi:tape measure domain-containing protein